MNLGVCEPQPNQNQVFKLATKWLSKKYKGSKFTKHNACECIEDYLEKRDSMSLNFNELLEFPHEYLLTHHYFTTIFALGIGLGIKGC
jgi:hypothetical protein